MGDTVLMDSSNVSASGSTIVGNSGTFEGLTTSFYTGVSNITAQDVWSGEADSVEFNSVAESMRNDLATAAQIINEVGANLQTTAAAFDETVAGNKARIGAI